MEEQKDSRYYGYERRILVEMLPAIGGRFLEVGCGQGATLEYVKSHGAAYVAGVDINPEAISVARGRGLDSALVADVEKEDLPYEKNSFDCIILADVLEHFHNPWDTLKKLSSYLKRDGALLISIPNMKHYSIMLRLLVHDEWTYTDAGILDRTHLRFFTLKEALALIAHAGLKTEKIKRGHQSGKLFRLMNILAFNGLRSYTAYQYYLLVRHDRLS